MRMNSMRYTHTIYICILVCQIWVFIGHELYCLTKSSNSTQNYIQSLLLPLPLLLLLLHGKELHLAICFLEFNYIRLHWVIEILSICCCCCCCLSFASHIGINVSKHRTFFDSWRLCFCHFLDHERCCSKRSDGIRDLFRMNTSIGMLPVSENSVIQIELKNFLAVCVFANWYQYVKRFITSKMSARAAASHKNWDLHIYY